MEKTEGNGLSTLEKSECYRTLGMGREAERGVHTEKKLVSDAGWGDVDSSSETKDTSGFRGYGDR